MGLFDINNGLRGGEPMYNMPTNTPLIQDGGPVGLMALLQFQPKVTTPIFDNKKINTPKGLVGEELQFQREQNELLTLKKNLSDEAVTLISKKGIDKFQQEDASLLNKLKEVINQEEQLKVKSDIVTRNKKTWDSNVSTMTSNNALNVKYINPETKKGEYVIREEDGTFHEVTTQDLEAGKMPVYKTLADHYQEMDWKDNNLTNKNDFATNLIGLDKKSDYENNFLKSWVATAASKNQGYGYSDQGNISKIVYALTNPGDASSDVYSYFKTSSKDQTSNVSNINTAIGLLDKGKFDVSRVVGLMSQQQFDDSFDNYLNDLESNPAKLDNGKEVFRDNVKSKSNKDYQKYVFMKLLTIAEPQYQTDIKVASGFKMGDASFTKGYNDKKDIALYYGDLGAQKPDKDKKYQLFANPGGMVEKVEVPLYTYSGFGKTKEFNAYLTYQNNAGLPVKPSQINPNELYFAGMSQPMAIFEKYGATVKGTTGDVQQFYSNPTGGSGLFSSNYLIKGSDKNVPIYADIKGLPKSGITAPIVNAMSYVLTVDSKEQLQGLLSELNGINSDLKQEKGAFTTGKYDLTNPGGMSQTEFSQLNSLTGLNASDIKEVQVKDPETGAIETKYEIKTYIPISSYKGGSLDQWYGKDFSTAVYQYTKKLQENITNQNDATMQEMYQNTNK